MLASTAMSEEAAVRDSSVGTTTSDSPAGTDPDGPRLAEVIAAEELASVPWWLFLVSGAAWVIFAFIVLSFDIETVWAIAVLAGITMIATAVNELVVASTVPSWRWAHALLGVLCLGAGIIALAWPEITFLALAALIGWFLLFVGVFDIVTSLVDRQDLWWLQLIAGVVQVAVAFWAIGYPDRSIALLVVWVAAGALIRGFTQMFLAFAVRDLSQRVACPDVAPSPSPSPSPA